MLHVIYRLVAIFVLIHVIVVVYRRYNNIYFKTTELLLSDKNAKIWGLSCFITNVPDRFTKITNLLGILLLWVSTLNLNVCYHDKPFCGDENFLAFDLILAVYYSFASSIPTFVQNIGRLMVIICFITLKSSYKKAVMFYSKSE